MLDEVLFVVIESFPILDILGKIDLFGCPESSDLIFVHLPDIVVLDWEEHKSVWVVFKEWLWKWALGLGVVAVLGLHVVHHVVLDLGQVVHLVKLNLL